MVGKEFTPVPRKEWEQLQRIVKTKMRKAKRAYHNWKHIQRFMKDAAFLAEREGLSELEKENIRLAALFHDIGYGVGKNPQELGHEKRGANHIEEVLKGTVLEPRIPEIQKLIIATDYRNNPKTTAEAIMRDADMAQKGRKGLNGYFRHDRSLRKECVETGTFEKKSEALDKLSLEIVSVPFFTATAQQHWEPVRLRNLEKMKRKKHYRDLRRKRNPAIALIKNRLAGKRRTL